MSKQQPLQRIMFHDRGLSDRMFMESRDGISLPMIWNNITGKNFENDPEGHRNYLLMLKIESGLPAGYIQYFPDYSKQDQYEEFLVPTSSDIEVYKTETVNRGERILFGYATKFDELFSETGTEPQRYVRGLSKKYYATEKCLEAIKRWHCTQWGHTSYFEMHDRKNGITDVYIKADQIIASSLFACIYTNSIPKEPEQQDETLATSGSKKVDAAKMNAMDVFKNCTIDGNTIRLPKQDLGKELYNEVKTILEKNGGNWKGGKIAGFVFKFDPSSIFEKLQSGEKVNNQQKFQFFGTPPELADYLVELACIQARHEILEPSAGQGAIIQAIHKQFGERKVSAFELMKENQEILSKVPRVFLLGEDFLAASLPEQFDRIVANPPFSSNQDIDHVKKMYACLKPGGRLVSIVSTSWKHGTQKKQEAFKTWLKEVGAMEENVPAGAFKKSGTTVPTIILVIDKK